MIHHRPIGLGLLVLGGLLPPGTLAGQDPAPSAPALPCRVLFAGKGGGMGRALLTGWGEEGPRLAARDGAALPPGRPFWLAPLAARRSDPGPVRVLLHGGGRVQGRRAVTDGEGEVLHLEGPPLGRLTVPVPRLRGLIYRERTRGWEEAELLARAAPGEEALLLVARRGFDPLEGFFYRLTEKAFHFAPTGREEPLTFPVARVAALVRGPGIAAGGKERAEEGAPACRLTFTDGTTLGVGITGLAGGKLAVKLPWGGAGRAGVERIAGLELAGPDHRFLSTLEPARVEERSWFGPDQPFLYPHRRDRACTGGPLLAGGAVWSRGLGCHSRCRLTYALEGEWKFFFTLAAMDDSAAELELPGRVDLQVLLDGRPVWESRDLRPGLEPVPVGPLSLAGAKELTLVVDYGGRLHVGDRVDWLLPVLYR